MDFSTTYQFSTLTDTKNDLSSQMKLQSIEKEQYICVVQRLRGGGDVTVLSPFWEGTAQRYRFPGNYLTNLLVKYVEFAVSLPTM